MSTLIACLSSDPHVDNLRCFATKEPFNFIGYRQQSRFQVGDDDSAGSGLVYLSWYSG
jgi:hypothetical protein